MAKTNTEDYLRMYRQMGRIRTFEDNANQLYLSAKMPGLTHMYSGEEGVAVGICEALTDSDRSTSTHRGHGHCVAKGGEFKEIFCELLGKEEGYCRGKGESMHIADQSHGNLGANAIVGGSMGIATGSALRAKLQGADDVTVCFFGDGATAQGLLYEVMNMAALWNLAVIYACENNGYSEYTRTEEIAAGSITARAEAFGIEAHKLDGQEVLAVKKLTQDLVARARRGEGPFFLELETCRYHGHHGGDINREYCGSKDEEKDWKENRDPIVRFRGWLVEQGIATEDKIKAMNAEIETDATPAAEAGAASRRLVAEVPEDGVPAFAAWAAAAHGLTDADAILAGLTAAVLPESGPVAVERHGPATTYALPADRALSGVAETGDDPALILRDLRGSRLTCVETGGESTPVLTLTRNVAGLTLTLECAASRLDARAAIQLLTNVADRVTQPLRHLL